MAKDLFAYVNQHPGRERSGEATSRLMISPEEGVLGHQPENIYAAVKESHPLLTMGGMFPYVAGEYTETKDNSSTILRGADGIEFKLQATPSDNDDVTVTGLAKRAIAAGKVMSFAARIKVSSAANLGFKLGFVTSSETEIFTADPADGVFLSKAKNSANLLGRVTENAQAADDSGTLATLADDTEIEVGFQCMPGATAATTWGFWYVKTAAGVLTKTTFTAAQLTALYTLVATTPPTLAAVVGCRVNGTTQRTGTVNYAFGSIDR